MTTDTTDDVELKAWIAKQRPSLRSTVERLARQFGDEAIRPLLEKQMQRDAQGESFRGQFLTQMSYLRAKELEAERIVRRVNDFHHPRKGATK